MYNLEPLDIRKLSTNPAMIYEAMLQAENDGFIILPWNDSKTAAGIKSQWYDICHKSKSPMIVVYIKNDGSGEVEYDLITCCRRADPRVDKNSLLLELSSMYEFYPRIKTKVCKDILASPGGTWGEYVFLKEDKQKVFDCVMKYIRATKWADEIPDEEWAEYCSR